MSRRIIDISEMPAALSLRGGLLVMTQGLAAEVTVPLDEIEAVLLSNPQCSITGRVMAELGKFGVSIVCSDETRLPTGIMLPIGEHGKIATRFALQAAMKLPVRKKLWGQVVRAKIRNQASVYLSDVPRPFTAGRTERCQGASVYLSDVSRPFTAQCQQCCKQIQSI
jgi:CRISPR-associated protein Cas1